MFFSFQETDSVLIKRFTEAASRGDATNLVTMLDAGMPVDICDAEGSTALIITAKLNNTDLTCLLLDRGADKNKQDVDGLTALHWAANKNSIDVIKVLLQQGASRSIKDKYGRNPYDHAKKCENKEAERLLQQH